MRTQEYYCGTKSFSKVMQAHGHKTFTVDIEAQFEPDVCIDVRNFTPASMLSFEYSPDILWASPPCQGFSVAVIGKNWNHDHTPKTASARLGMELAIRTLDLIEDIKPQWWFVENPRGKLRRMPFMFDPEATEPQEKLHPTMRQGGYGASQFLTAGTEIHA